MVWPKEQTLRNAIEGELEEHDESWADIESCILSDQDLDRPFDSCRTEPFVIWTGRRVYFPVDYDDGCNLYVFSVPRHPDGKPAVYIEVPS